MGRLREIQEETKEEHEGTTYLGSESLKFPLWLDYEPGNGDFSIA